MAGQVSGILFWYICGVWIVLGTMWQLSYYRHTIDGPGKCPGGAEWCGRCNDADI